MAVAGSPSHPPPYEPPYYEHPLDDTVHHEHFRPRPRPGPSRGILVVVFFLVLVLIGAFLYSVRAGFHGLPSSSSGPQTIVGLDASWNVEAQSIYQWQFQISAGNGTLFGNFTSNGQETDMLLLNVTQQANFTENLTSAELYATGPVRLAPLDWVLPSAGTYFLIAWNEEQTPVTVDWVTSVQYVV